MFYKEAHGEKEKILIVEDEPKIAEAIEAYLNKNQYNTIVAYNGREALNLFQEEHPDMVILDLMLPYVSGEEVCKSIRKQSGVPIIMLTAKVSEDSQIEGFDMGADDYIKNHLAHEN